MPIFEVRQTDATTFRNGQNAFIVAATDSAAALLSAQAETSVGASLNGATVTQLGTGSAMSTSGAFDGWRVRIAITNNGQVDIIGGASDNLDAIGTALATVLNNLAGISGAQYTAASQTLRVAQGSGVDDLGDETVTVFIRTPVVYDAGGGSQLNDDDDQSPSFVSSITHEGSSSSDLTVLFKADSTIMPGVLWTLRR